MSIQSAAIAAASSDIRFSVIVADRRSGSAVFQSADDDRSVIDLDYADAIHRHRFAPDYAVLLVRDAAAVVKSNL